jgi:hypothetical protein
MVMQNNESLQYPDPDASLEDAEEEESQEESSDKGEEVDPVQALDQKYSSQFEDLRRTVGRVQSITSQFDKGTANDETVQKLSEQFQSTSDQLEALVSGLDENSIDPALRERIVQAQQQARSVAERTSLKQEILEEVKKEQTPVADPAPNQAMAVEAAMLKQMQEYGVDSTDDAFDWTKAREHFQAGDMDALGTWMRTGIKTALAASDSDGRRQARKESGKPAPKAASEGKSKTDAILEDGEWDNLDEAVQALRDQGLTIG